jgi:hypothetical protein
MKGNEHKVIGDYVLDYSGMHVIFYESQEGTLTWALEGNGCSFDQGTKSVPFLFRVLEGAIGKSIIKLPEEQVDALKLEAVCRHLDTGGSDGM